MSTGQTNGITPQTANDDNTQDIDIVFKDEGLEPGQKAPAKHSQVWSGYSQRSGHSEMVDIDMSKRSGSTRTPNVSSPNVDGNQELYTNTDLAAVPTNTDEKPVVDFLADESATNTSIWQKLVTLSKKLEYVALALSIFALLFSIIVLSSVSGSMKTKMNEYEETYNATLTGQLHYHTVDTMDEFQTIYVGNYYGWSFAAWRDASYRKNNADYQGDSGLTNVRGFYDGQNEWDDATFTNQGSGSIHDHAESLRVLGLGELQAVLNGVEFQTHHSDYNLEMPSLTSNEYGATEPIPFPDVPPEVTNAGSVDAQIDEMREWFRAFKTQDKTHRNYTDYFKPVLCVLEGAWITDNDELSEPFESDLSELGASTYSDMQDKMRYFANSGRKTLDETLGHLPSAIRNTENTSMPIVSNLDYRIVCHPLKSDVPTSRFRVVDDIAVQLYGSVLTRAEMKYSRRARFELNTYINLDDIVGDTQWTTGRKKWNFADYLMEQVIGKDGVGVNLTDSLPDGTGQALHYVDDKVMNTGYYSRYYKLGGADAMGSTGHRRSWCDRNLFVAKSTQDKISPIDMAFEAVDENTSQIIYYPTISKWTYAIPLEIVYLTPLTKWNPYNINEKDDSKFNYDRTGDCDDSPFDGWSSNNAYFTPSKFYAADNNNICAKGSDGKSYSVAASGHYVVLQEIGGDVGHVRTRYPIYPLHERGSSEYKELKALQDVMLPDDYDSANATDLTVNGTDFWNTETRDLLYGIELSLQGGSHEHNVYIPGWKLRQVWYDEGTEQWSITSDDYIEVDSEEVDGHQHTVRVWMQSREDQVYVLKACRYGAVYDDDEEDWNDDECEDHHDQVSRY